jgi:hypothetical protein
VRQVLASDDRLGIYEVRDDRGQIIFISQTLAYNVWAQTEV